MPKLSIWNSGRKSNDYRFIDGTIAEFFNIGGTAVYVHKYMGTYDEDGNATMDPTSIQDMLFLENRDRAYDKDTLELRGVYNVHDSDFDLRQFGIFLNNDDIFLEFHLNGMLAIVGRKIMSGDVLELPHQREDAFLDEKKPAANKYYVVTDANRASNGYSQTWFPHIWRVKCTPLTNSQEYKDILDKPPEDPFGLLVDDPDYPSIGDIIGNLDKDMEINDAVIQEAKKYVPKRNYETQQFWIVPGSDKEGEYPWIFAGDGIPPNGAALVGSGKSFPANPLEGDYYLRLDYEPHVLFRREGPRWRRVEIDYRKEDWSMAHRLLETYINNNNITTFDDGTQQPEKQALSKAVKPRADF